jgi:hypothetical protein
MVFMSSSTTLLKPMLCFVSKILFIHSLYFSILEFLDPHQWNINEKMIKIFTTITIHFRLIPSSIASPRLLTWPKGVGSNGEK